MKNGNKSRVRTDIFYTFDIETTTLITGLDADNEPIRNGVIWSGQFYDGSNYDQVRSLQEVIDYLKAIEKRESDLESKVCIFVHNLSYEFAFIKDFFNITKILNTDARKIISVETDHLVFRCSYFLSNMSLDKFLQAEKVPEEYQKTNMDYLKERFPWTELTEEEKIYCKNDVVGLHLAIENRIAKCYNGDINNLPLTSTGYVRKDCRKACAQNYKNRYRFKKERLDYDTFNMCHRAFRGGNTHANKMYANKVIKNVFSDDIASSYPFELLTKKFPTVFHNLNNYTRKEFNFFLDNWTDWAMLIEVVWINIRLKNPAATPVPYIPTSKCEKLKYLKPDDLNEATTNKEQLLKRKEEKVLKVDNGRLLGPAYLVQMTLTEIDYKIIASQYEWDEEKIVRVKYSRKKPIMPELSEQIKKYYFDKTLLKQDEHDPNFDEDIDYQYKQSKGRLNGIYGMHVTNPCKPNWDFNNVAHMPYIIDTSEEELLDQYYESFASFLSYQVGPWVSAYARLDLQECIDVLLNKDDPNKSDLIYCDTDSVKFINYESHKSDIDAINKRKIQEAEEHGAYCDRDGIRYHLGVFSEEGEAKFFKTFGAKKYIYGDNDNFKITISGVPKKLGAKQIAGDFKTGKLASPFDIEKGYVFQGIKLTSCYNDYLELQHYDVDGGRVYFGSNVALYPTPYTLGITHDFEMLLFLFEEYMQ